MTITYPPARVAIDGQDASASVAEALSSAHIAGRDPGIPLQLVDCGDLVVNKGRLGALACGGVSRFTFDFAQDGPAPVGAFVLGNIPAGSIIRNGFIETLVQTAGGTIAIGLNGGAEILAAANPAVGLSAIIPTGAVANMVVSATTQPLTMTVATGALTAGQFHLFMDIVLGGAV